MDNLIGCKRSFLLILLATLTLVLINAQSVFALTTPGEDMTLKFTMESYSDFNTYSGYYDHKTTIDDTSDDSIEARPIPQDDNYTYGLSPYTGDKLFGKIRVDEIFNREKYKEEGTKDPFNDKEKETIIGSYGNLSVSDFSLTHDDTEDTTSVEYEYNTGGSFFNMYLFDNPHADYDEGKSDFWADLTEEELKSGSLIFDGLFTYMKTTLTLDDDGYITSVVTDSYVDILDNPNAIWGDSNFTTKTKTIEDINGDAIEISYDATFTALSYPANSNGEWDYYSTVEDDPVVTDFNAANSATVPEPSTVILVGLGLLGISGLGRKKLMK